MAITRGRALLESSGAEVVFGDVVPGGLDSIYTFDPAMVTPSGSIILSPGKELRRPEATTTAEDMSRIGIPVAATLTPPAKAEGGDLLWLDESTVVVGRSYRTNAAGVAALRAALPDVEIIEFDLPHFRGPSDVARP